MVNVKKEHKSVNAHATRRQRNLAELGRSERDAFQLLDGDGDLQQAHVNELTRPRRNRHTAQRVTDRYVQRHTSPCAPVRIAHLLAYIFTAQIFPTFADFLWRSLRQFAYHHQKRRSVKFRQIRSVMRPEFNVIFRWNICLKARYKK